PTSTGRIARAARVLYFSLLRFAASVSSLPPFRGPAGAAVLIPGSGGPWRLAKVPKSSMISVARFRPVSQPMPLDLLEQGSPTPSATCPRESVLPIRLRPDFSVIFKGYASEAEHRPRCQVAQKGSLRCLLNLPDLLGCSRNGGNDVQVIDGEEGG